MHLTGIFIYPVKSLGGFSVPSASVDALGLVGDRRFLVVDETGRFLTQRVLPRMALIATSLDEENLTLAVAGGPRISVPLASDPRATLRTVQIWRSEGLMAEDCGAGAAGFLSAFLGTSCRLVRAGEKFCRPILKPAARAGEIFTFADAVPLLVVSEASLADLNDRIIAGGEEPVPMNRFRPNLVVAGCDPFAEDALGDFRLGEVSLRSAGPSIRCILTTTNQVTADRGKEPLRTLATYRRDAVDPTSVCFGQNLINTSKSGRLQVGDSIELGR